ncbi:MAG: DUF2892 domain-containing protein [Candidatus Dormibacteria bacterium]
MGIARWMAKPAGRVVRVVAGGVLIGVGTYLHDTTGVVLMVVGLVPLLAGVGNVCLLAPALSCPFRGSQVR